jgi:hypothetical protein
MADGTEQRVEFLGATARSIGAAKMKTNGSPNQLYKVSVMR